MQSRNPDVFSAFRNPCFISTNKLDFGPFKQNQRRLIETPRGGGRGGGEWALPCKWLMGMCRWMGYHFHHWIDYNGVAFSIELLEWGRTFSDFRGKTVLIYG